MTKSYLTEAYLQGEERQKFIKDFQALLDEAEPEKEYVDKEVCCSYTAMVCADDSAEGHVQVEVRY